MTDKIVGQDLDEQQLQSQLVAQRAERIRECEQAIGKVLEKYKCQIVPIVSFSPRGTEFNLMIESTEG